MIRYVKGVFLSALLIVTFSLHAEDLPYLNTVQQLEFGELMGFTGSCSLDYDSKILTDNGGSLCPFSGVRYGEPGKYLIVANFNADVEVQITSHTANGDGILYTPSGIFRVHGEPDIPIIADQKQTISSGTTGVITILLGGTLTLTANKAFDTTFTVTTEQGIIFNEVD
ncbi:hypothetical protein [Paraglaciecola sp. L1A13]|uniref:hypothetical protein n=1 Tax=Paraglaciecola sp. L1A13 TaxID=2686359 RepID=UPI00131D998D|nr:hypothetical protein [Paraglaciecola sp. L1A13]